VSDAKTGLYSRSEIAWFGTPFEQHVLLISVAVIRLHSENEVETIGESQIKMTLEKDMIEAYRFPELSRTYEYASHSYCVMQEKHRYVLGMLNSVVESVVCWLCNESGVNRSDVMAM